MISHFHHRRSDITSRPGSNEATAVYSVSSASKSDEGSYVCEATNEAGSREEMVQVIVVDGDGGVGGGGAAGNWNGGGGIGGDSGNWNGDGGNGGGGGSGGGIGGSASSGGVQVDRQQFTAPLGGNAELRCFLVGK